MGMLSYGSVHLGAVGGAVQLPAMSHGSYEPGAVEGAVEGHGAGVCWLREPSRIQLEMGCARDETVTFTKSTLTISTQNK